MGTPFLQSKHWRSWHARSGFMYTNWFTTPKRLQEALLLVLFELMKVEKEILSTISATREDSFNALRTWTVTRNEC